MKELEIQILFEHYNDTYRIIQGKIKQRDKLFAYILITLIFMLFIVYSPKDAPLVLSQFLSKQIGLNNPIDFSFLGSVLWFLLLSFIIRYFQILIGIERSYCYIHKVEAELSAGLKQKLFSREGASYLDDYPLFLNWASSLFNIGFPCVLVVVATAKIIFEVYSGLNNFSFLLLINILFFLAIIISLVIYLVSIYETKKPEKD